MSFLCVYAFLVCVCLSCVCMPFLCIWLPVRSRSLNGFLLFGGIARFDEAQWRLCMLCRGHFVCLVCLSCLFLCENARASDRFTTQCAIPSTYQFMCVLIDLLIECVFFIDLQDNARFYQHINTCVFYIHVYNISIHVFFIYMYIGFVLYTCI
jgi:hypothetical protein